MSIYDDPDGFADWNNDEPSRKPSVTRKKGETIRRYKHRTLHIRYPMTEKEWERAKKKRRSIASKNRKLNEYANPNDYKSWNRYQRARDSYGVEMRKKDASQMGIEDMRALLKDEHWEEYCGHKRWLYDRRSTIKEFNKYLMQHKMY